MKSPRWILAALGLLIPTLVIAQEKSIPPGEVRVATAPDYKSIEAELLQIRVEDQKYRLQQNDVEKKHGRDSQQMQDLWKVIKETDAANLIKVTAILDNYGWLGADQIGPKANGTLFLVIQHSDLATQQKYLPMMRTAVRDGKANASALALLEDRVALGQGRPQIYGSQIMRDQTHGGKYYVRPIADPDKVDERRAAVGLEPLADYVKKYDIVWDVEAHKKEMPELLALLERLKK
jgi:hypothetical protein